MEKLLLLGGAQALVVALHKSTKQLSDVCTNTSQFYQRLRTGSYQTIILDALFTGAETMELCKQVRAINKNSALLVLNAHCGHFHPSRLMLAGADDCITGPVDSREVVARLKAAQRRHCPAGYTTELLCEHIRLDLTAGLAYSNEKPLHLRPLEYALLEFLMRNQGTVFSVETLSRSVWKRKIAPAESIRAHIYTLRRKTCASSFDDGYDQNGSKMVIHTIHGRGYMMSGRNTATDIQISCQQAKDSLTLIPDAWQPPQPEYGQIQPTL